MMNAPSRPSLNGRQVPRTQLNPQVNVAQSDSDEDYLDDYLLEDSESEGSDDDYMATSTKEKFDPDREATLAEIGTLPMSKVEKKLEGACSICL